MNYGIQAEISVVAKIHLNAYCVKEKLIKY